MLHACHMPMMSLQAADALSFRDTSRKVNTLPVLRVHQPSSCTG
jgi:hypothetical protein